MCYQKRILKFVLFFCFLVGPYLYGFKSHSEDEVLFIPSLKDEVVSSEEAFDRLFQEIGAIDPNERNYSDLIQKITELYTQYPGTESAQRAAQAISLWAESGFISSSEAEAALQGSEQWVNPGADELSDLISRWEQLQSVQDTEGMRQLTLELGALSDKYPGTTTGFTAAALLPEVYTALGDSKLTFQATYQFLQDYPPSKNDYWADDTLSSTRILAYARLVSTVENIDDGMAIYRAIADTEGISKAMGFSALFEAGEIALQFKRDEEAIQFFKDVYDRYPEEVNSGLALIRIAEIYIANGDLDAALDAYRYAANVLRGHFADAAAKGIDAVLKAKDKLANKKEEFAVQAVEYSEIAEQESNKVDDTDKDISIVDSSRTDKKLGSEPISREKVKSKLERNHNLPQASWLVAFLPALITGTCIVVVATQFKRRKNNEQK